MLMMLLTILPGLGTSGAIIAFTMAKQNREAHLRQLIDSRNELEAAAARPKTVQHAPEISGEQMAIDLFNQVAHELGDELGHWIDGHADRHGCELCVKASRRRAQEAKNAALESEKRRRAQLVRDKQEEHSRNTHPLGWRSETIHVRSNAGAIVTKTEIHEREAGHDWGSTVCHCGGRNTKWVDPQAEYAREYKEISYKSGHTKYRNDQRW